MLSAILVSGAFPRKVCASAQEVTASFFGNHADSDNNKENGYFCNEITIKNKYFNKDICNYSEAPHGEGGRIQLFFVILDGVLHPAYCIEPGAPVNGSWVYNGASGVNSSDPYWEYIRNNYKETAEAISLTIGYSNQYSTASDFSGARAACQLIVWEIIGGYRDPASLKVTDTALREATAGIRFEKYYTLISNQLMNHYTYTSFVATDENSTPTITLPYSEEKEEWGIELTTTSGNIDMIDYTPLTEQDISVEKIDDKTIYLYTKNKIPSAKTYTVYKHLPGSLYSDNLYVWTSYTSGGRGQCIVSGTDNEATPLYIKLETEPVYRNIEINYYDKYTNEKISNSFALSATEHLSEYDVSEHILSEIKYKEILYNHDPKLNSGDAITGILDNDKTINLFYGYTHDITINYYDKYTGQKISQSYISEPAEHNTDYDAEKHTTLMFDGYDFIDHIEGDALTGVLDCDKTINVYYGYNHDLTIEYRDEETYENIAETVIYLPNGEHNSDYDKTSDITLNIDGYTRTKITGDSEQGILDSDKSIIVWYKKDYEASPETSDLLTTSVLCGLTVFSACMFTLLRKRKKEL